MNCFLLVKIFSNSQRFWFHLSTQIFERSNDSISLYFTFERIPGENVHSTSISVSGGRSRSVHFRQSVLSSLFNCSNFWSIFFIHQFCPFPYLVPVNTSYNNAIHFKVDFCLTISQMFLLLGINTLILNVFI